MTEKRRVSPEDFNQEFVLTAVLLSEGDFDRPIRIDDVKKHLKVIWHDSWIVRAISHLEKHGSIKFSNHSLSSRSLRIGDATVEEYLKELSKNLFTESESFYITEHALKLAHIVANYREKDLWEMMDQFHSNDSPRNIASGPIVDFNEPYDFPEPIKNIDHLSDVLRGMQADIAETIKIAKAASANDPESAQKIAELEAGSTLLKAPQADVGLVERLLLPTLTWLLKKTGDEAAKRLIKKLIDDVINWLS